MRNNKVEITGKYELNMPQQTVWNSMFDPVVLTECIPACKSIEKVTDQEFFARVDVKFGFVPVKFDVTVMLSNMLEPEQYVLSAKAHGGLANAAKATGTVDFLKLNEQKTRVEFLGHILPGSKLFELGEPLVQKTAAKWFNRFFHKFEQVIARNRV